MRIQLSDILIMFIGAWLSVFEIIPDGYIGGLVVIVALLIPRRIA